MLLSHTRWSYFVVLRSHNSHSLKQAQVRLSPQPVEGDTAGLWTLRISLVYLPSSASSLFSQVDKITLLKRSGFHFRRNKLAVVSGCFLMINYFLFNAACSLFFPSVGSPSSCSSLRTECHPLELWSVTMVFVSSLSNAIITLNSYRVREIAMKFPKFPSHSLKTSFFLGPQPMKRTCHLPAGDSQHCAGAAPEILNRPTGCLCIVRGLQPLRLTHLFSLLRC